MQLVTNEVIERAICAAAVAMMEGIWRTEAAIEPLVGLLAAVGALPQKVDDEQANEAVFLKRVAMVEETYGYIRDDLLGSGALMDCMRHAVERVTAGQVLLPESGPETN